MRPWKAPRRAAGVLFLALALPSGPAGAQSLLASGGFGTPVDAVDARGRALGGIGVGLLGGEVSAVDPTAAADLGLPGVSFTLVSTWVDVPEGEDFTATRFPSVGAAYPAGSLGTLTLTFGGILDQRWTSTRSDVVQFEGRQLTVTDRFVSDGGVGTVRLGLARRVAPSLGLGVSAGVLTGDVTRRLTRSFDTAAAPSAVDDFQAGGRWEYSGATASAGAVVDVSELFRATAVLTWNGTLDAEASPDTEAGDASFDLPLEARGGLTAILAPGLAATVGVHWADWSAVDAGEAAEGVGSTLSFGGGLEWARVRLLGRAAALRLGYRRAELPFSYLQDEPVETAWTGGLGLVLARAGPLELARLDLGVARGSRNSGGLEEGFWSSSLSLRVSGF